MEKGQQQLLESMPDGIVVADEKGGIEFVSRRALKMSGYTSKELIGRNVDMLVPTGKRPAHRGNRNRYFANPTSRAMGSGLNISLRRKDGTEFPVDIALSPLKTSTGLRVIAAVRDVSDRERIEKALREAEEQVRLMVEGVVDYAIFELDAEGRVASWNAGAQRIKGYRADEIIGRHFSIFYPPDEVKKRKPQHALATARRSGRFEEEGVRLKKDGSEFWASVVLAALHDPAGKVRGFVKVTRDITERKRVQDRLEQLLVMEDRERIARELHDGAIQSLFAVGMGLQGLAVRTTDAEIQARIEASVVQIDRVIRDLRNYIFGLRPGILADSQLHQALTRVAQDFQKRTGVTTVVDIDPHVAARLNSQAGELIQLTTEALSNVARHAEATTCRVSLHSNQSGVVLEVDDDGKGFNKARVQGTGQGMRNLRERANKLGGRLLITSKPHQGTSVRVTIRI